MNGFEAALVIIYNHKYEKNIPIVEAIYRNKFKYIFHLVPFYAGTRPNVIPVYENSHFFQGYVAQGFKSFFRPELTHYILLADDLILNPAISGDNYHTYFKLEPESCFIPRLDSVPKGFAYWSHYRNAILFDPFRKRGVEVAHDLPPTGEAAKLLARHGISNGAFTFGQVYGRLQFPVTLSRVRHNARRLCQYVLDRLLYNANLHGTKYPLARSYSDVAVISSVCVERFCHYCGVFSATELFAELAIPTALALAADKIVTEKELALQGKALWSADQLNELNQYGQQLGELFRRFPQTYLYLHPIKLSKWRVDDI